MDNTYDNLYQQLMTGYDGSMLTRIEPTLKSDGTIVQLSSEGFYNNGEAAYAADKE